MLHGQTVKGTQLYLFRASGLHLDLSADPVEVSDTDAGVPGGAKAGWGGPTSRWRKPMKTPIVDLMDSCYLPGATWHQEAWYEGGGC